MRDVLNSRDSVFASELAELGGVNIVLNSLTSSGMVAGSLAGLRQGGRFVEISKRDIWSPARMAQGKPTQCPGTNPALPMSRRSTGAAWLTPYLCPPCPAERPDVLYTLVAVDFLDSRAVNTALCHVSSQLADGVLQPLPQVVHGLSAVQAAPESPDAWWALLQMEDSQLAGSTGALDRAARGGVVLMDLYRWATKLCPRQSNARSEAFVKLWLGFARQQWCAGAEKAGRGPRVPAGPPPR